MLTIHRSKGLEFPIVYCPFLWDPSWIPTRAPVVVPRSAAGNRRTIDVGLEGPGFQATRSSTQIEQRGEDLRLAYVALTRAMHQAVIWWVGSTTSRNSPLERLLFAKARRRQRPAVRPHHAHRRRRAATVRGAGGARAGPDQPSSASPLGAPTAWSPALEPPVELVAARFDRQLDLGLAADLLHRHHRGGPRPDGGERARAADPQRRARDGHAGPGRRPGRAGPRARPPFAARRRCPSGSQFGTFVHTVLEATDFAAADLDGELAERVAAPASRRPTELDDPRRR